MNIIEIGAHDGGNTAKFFKEAKIWSFEPNPFYVKKLKDRYENNNNVMIIDMAVSDYNGTSFFNISEDGQSSSLHELTNYAKINTKIKYTSQITVNVIRMDTFLNENNIDIVNYLQCDAQGNDLTILKSFGEKLSCILSGKIEASLNHEIYGGAPNNLEASIKFLNDNGFKISNLDYLNKVKKNPHQHDVNIEFYKLSNENLI